MATEEEKEEARRQMDEALSSFGYAHAVVDILGVLKQAQLAGIATISDSLILQIGGLQWRRREVVH
jgi:hypothetical protein